MSFNTGFNPNNYNHYHHSAHQTGKAQKSDPMMASLMSSFANLNLTQQNSNPNIKGLSVNTAAPQAGLKISIPGTPFTPIPVTKVQNK